MRATSLEFRLRVYIITGILLFGFWSPGFRTRTLWSAAASAMAPHAGGMLTASLTVAYLAGTIALLGALLRTWATAYMGAGVVFDREMHAGRVVAYGPYRFVRNPLYIGSELSFIAAAVVMPWWSGLGAIVLLALFQYRLILGEENHLAATPGYADYKAAVPRLFPAMRPALPQLKARAYWAQAALAEIYFFGVAGSFFVFAHRFDHSRVLQGIGVSFGLSLIVRALGGNSLG